jgi:phosphoribosyl 1,2-cyclic phosphodiesterase
MADKILKFLGVVGSSPVVCSKDRKYGSHTICSTLETGSEEIFIIDAGTGLIRLGNLYCTMPRPEGRRIHILLTHFHLDHVLGLPFFKPLFAPKARITFYTPWDPQETQNTLQELMGGRYFPVDFMDTASTKNFKQLPEDISEVAGVRVSWCPLNHPQGSVAYRLEHQGRSWVLATDTEHPEDGEDERLTGFCQDADALVYDAMYTPEEYPEKVGWGHSTWIQGTRMAERAGIKSLFLSHLNPDHTGAKLDEMLSQARQAFPRTEIASEEII